MWGVHVVGCVGRYEKDVALCAICVFTRKNHHAPQTTKTTHIPDGVVSKNNIGAARTAFSNDTWSLRAATKPAYAKLNARTRVNTLLTAAMMRRIRKYHHTSLCEGVFGGV